MKNNEFICYLENLLQEARIAILPGSLHEKPLFQGAMMGILACDKESAFTSEQVIQIIKTVLDYEKAPGNEGSTGQRK